MSKASLFHPTRCALGEGPLWAGDRLFFFDVLGHALHALDASGQDLTTWPMGEHASAAARLPGGDLLIASESSLSRFTPQTGARSPVIDLEADSPQTRSNDGRADRQGGFWIGTMGKAAEEGAGALYRFAGGVLHKLLDEITIPNAISFSPDGRTGYFADSAEGIIYRWSLDPRGFPQGTPEPHYRHEGQGAPDGAVVDANGTLWCALWEEAAILAISPDGTPGTRLSLPASRPTCPAFGPDGRLFVTSARQGMSAEELAGEPDAGSVYVLPFGGPPLEEPEAILP
ncbi:MAG: SMP-30/gluconolactonase/LRE family protein [Pseudomonadota bacterium]